MTDWHNETVPGHQEQEPSTDEYQRSECVLGYIPVIYYSILLCVGFPGRKHEHLECHMNLNAF